jgi:nucleotide-binding universal stress UspA family protein
MHMLDDVTDARTLGSGREEVRQMFRAILVPLDGSALADYALAWAVPLARRTDATLHLARVVEPPTAWLAPPTIGSPYLPDRFHDEALRAMAETAAIHLQATARHLSQTGLRVEVAQLDGFTTSALLDYERSAHIDLVTMCGRGRGGLVRLIFGSVADDLVHNGSAPVLRVRSFGAPTTFPQALAPLDGSPHAEAALDVVEQLAHHEVVRAVRLLRVIGAAEEGPEAESYLAAVAKRLERSGIACRYQVVMGKVAQSIREQAGADHLVVMATRGREGLARIVRGSVADKVACGNVAAVLAVREAPSMKASVSVLPTLAERARVREQAIVRASG